ncbi:MAG: TIGR02302 family protein, partial [Rhizobiales bacterium]|nr:TIGR02302 family protein [Hyphomicrobiales bacterium]
MTDRPPASPDGARHAAQDRIRDASSVQDRLTRALKRAWWVLGWERIWPRLALVATAAGLALALSWFGLWPMLPPLGRAIGVGIAALVLLAALAPFARLRTPTRLESLNRLDHASGVSHRPATALSDCIAVGRDDAASQKLWEAHLARTVATAERLKAGIPRPRLADRDPYAIRALVLLLVVASFVVAGGDRVRRLASAFDWRGAVASANYRIDAWVTPPVYTGRPPVLLPGIRAGEPVRDAQELQELSVPAGSVLVVRASGIPIDADVTGLTEGDPDKGARPPAGAEERRFTINDRGTLTLRGVPGREVTWRFNAVADRAPTIALTKDPEPQLRGPMLLTYRMDDDYGVVAAEATIARKPATNASAVTAKPPRPLYEAPKFPLVLPQARTRNGTAQTTKDLSDHPWAGSTVALTLTARDEAGNEGHSDPHEFRLPQRPFYKPVARALVEQRQILALDAEARGRVLIGLDALTI